MTTPVRDRTDVASPAALVVCRLRQRSGGRGASPLAGEVELENVSSSVVEVPIRSSPLEHLNLIVHDAGGRLVSAGHYGDLLSPQLCPSTFRLRPGEKYLAPVSFLATVPEVGRQHGDYSVQAVFEHERIRAVSEPYRLAWRAGG